MNRAQVVLLVLFFACLVLTAAGDDRAVGCGLLYVGASINYSAALARDS